jgi:hypothetical protein
MRRGKTMLDLLLNLLGYVAVIMLAAAFAYVWLWQYVLWWLEQAGVKFPMRGTNEREK